MTAPKADRLTPKEHRACFKHAKDHVLEALRDVMTDEHHSIMSVNGVEKTALNDDVQKHLMTFFKSARGIKYKPSPKRKALL